MKCQLVTCKYKIKTLFGKCSICNKEYCRRHRLPFEHRCNNRKLKRMHKKSIMENNPVIEKQKIKDAI